MFFIFFLIILLPIFLYVAKSYTLSNKEKKAYETMLLSPNDTTVSQYIQAFISANGFFSKASVTFGLVQTNNESVRLANKMRQAQGYQIIIQNPNVSDQVKEQLRKAFVSKGVPIQ